MQQQPNVTSKVSLCDQCHKPGKSHCSKCKCAVYCSRECQVKDWPQHKLRCAQLAAQADEISTALPAASAPRSDLSKLDALKFNETVSMLGQSSIGQKAIKAADKNVDAKLYLASTLIVSPNPAEKRKGFQLFEEVTKLADTNPAQAAQAEQRLGVEFFAPHFMGDVIAADDTRAKKHFKRAEKLYLKVIGGRDPRQVLNRDQQESFGLVLYNLGYMYALGGKQNAKLKKGLEYLKRGAEYGDPDACVALSDFYRLGTSDLIPKDLKEAKRLLLRGSAASSKVLEKTSNADLRLIEFAIGEQHVDEALDTLTRALNDGKQEVAGEILKVVAMSRFGASQKSLKSLFNMLDKISTRPQNNLLATYIYGMFLENPSVAGPAVTEAALQKNITRGRSLQKAAQTYGLSPEIIGQMTMLAKHLSSM